MLDTATSATAAADAPSATGKPTARTRWRAPRPGATAAAVAVYAALLPVALWAPGALGADPFRLRTAMIPIVVGAALLLATAITATAMRRGGGGRAVAVVCGVAAGLFAVWTAFTMRVGLTGAAYGYAGLRGDKGRLSALAMRHTVTMHSSDGIVQAAPSEYPPLYPWLIGRAGVLLDVPAWRLFGAAEAIACSLAVVVCFVLWRRSVAAPVALALAVVSLVVFPRPDKAFEVFALMVVVPWTLAAVAAPARRDRLHWAVAGLLGGLMVLLYQGYLMFAALGIVTLAVLAWRRSPDRRRYALHLLGLVLTAAVAASWYLGPYLAIMATRGLQMTDVFNSTRMLDHPMPFLAATPLGALELAGLAGLVWYRRRERWAETLLVLLASAYLYRLVFLAGYVLNGHTKVLHYTDGLIQVVLACAGVLTVTRAAPVVARRLQASAPAGLPVLALAVLVAWTGVEMWRTWLPGAPPSGGAGEEFQISATLTPNSATRAFTEPLPDGNYSPFAPEGLRAGWFPAGPVAEQVRSVLGPGARPVTLSVDERLFAVMPWPGYVGVDRSASGSTTHWYSRVRALKKLARVSDPARFAAASARTPFGGIDAFVLRRKGPHWEWTAYGHPTRVRFTPGQFASPAFARADLPNGLVMAVRRGSPGG
ncbi:arabinofuranosyltransferase [Actinomadura hibisca]|uniref:arabinofuranosyltransferase n=1 Tax=Actinomadura hibisca TaxID=68565 RepID=UPI00082EEF1C|nr:arabinofuranosyltransferase [Actinomadura hibisca]